MEGEKGRTKKSLKVENSRGLNIPMPGDAESLNVAQAATVILFEYVRRLF